MSVTSAASQIPFPLIAVAFACVLIGWLLLSSGGADASGDADGGDGGGDGGGGD